MLLKNFSNKKSIFMTLVLIILLCSNIFYIYKYYHTSKRECIKETVIFNEDSDYNAETKYYTEINYTKFNALLKKDTVSLIAILDNSSKTYNRFLETTNLLSYRMKKSIYVLEVSKLSKKNAISFYEVDDRLKDLESDYIIAIANDKVMSITSFDTIDLTYITNYLK